MTVSPSSTLVELIEAQPSAARVLDRHRIDYCYRGERRLDDAAAEVFTPIDSLLEALAIEESWIEVPTGKAALLDYLVAHHRYALEVEVPRLCRLADRVVAETGSLLARAVRECLHALARELISHVRETEAGVFRALREPRGAIWSGMRATVREHAELCALLAELRRVTSDFVAQDDACAASRELWLGLEAFEHDLHFHIHLERNVLFKRSLPITP